VKGLGGGELEKRGSQRKKKERGVNEKKLPLRPYLYLEREIVGYSKTAH
jgi:hypothetical protein